MYKYYMKVESYEHMLSPLELAKLYKIKTLTDKPHARLVARLLSDYIDSNKIPRMYYHTAKGDMFFVCPSYIYKPILDKFVEEHEHNTELTIEFPNKNHYCVIGE